MITPTNQQTEILNTKVEKGDILIIEALAGCAKTTTLYMLAKAHPNEKFLYLVFNKANKDEAKQKMPSNVTVHTYHSLALSLLPQFRGRITSNGIQSFDLYKKLLKEKNITISNAELAVTLKLFQLWCQTDKKTVSEIDVSDITPPNFITKNALNIASKNIINRAINKTQKKEKQAHLFYNKINSQLKGFERKAKLAAETLYQIYSAKDYNGLVTHDFYLKLFQLEQKKINTDWIILDEAQDTNLVSSGIFLSQNHTKRVLVGDTHQAIYQWRGATDAIKLIRTKYPKIKEKTLSETFRFGNNLANLAGNFLKKTKFENKEYTGLKTDTNIYKISANNPITQKFKGWTILSRTNKDLWEKAHQAVVAGLKPKFIGGIESYGLAEIEDMVNMIKYKTLAEFKKVAKVKCPKTHQFESIEQLRTHCELGIDQQSSMFFTAASCPDTWSKIQEIKASQSPGQPDITFTTCHRAKGLEWDHVYISDDFPNFTEINTEIQIKLKKRCINLKQAIAQAQIELNNLTDTENNHKRELENIVMEANLLYVSITRAKKNLLLPDYLHQYLTTDLK